MTRQEAGRMGGLIGGNLRVARVGGHALARTARAGLWARWEREVDAAADGAPLTAQDRAQRVAALQKAHCARMRAARRAS